MRAYLYMYKEISIYLSINSTNKTISIYIYIHICPQLVIFHTQLGYTTGVAVAHLLGCTSRDGY